MVTRMREKGQVTIPVDIRDSLHLSKDSMLTVIKVGDGIFLTPRASVFESVSAKFSKIAHEQGVSLDDLLNDLRKNRRKES